jgi:hypothetical protein
LPPLPGAEGAFRDKDEAMSTKKEDLRKWFDEGVEKGAIFMIVCTDTYDHNDYPVYAKTAWEAWVQFQAHDGRDMQKVMEVYDLLMDREIQMIEFRAFHMPTKPQDG